MERLRNYLTKEGLTQAQFADMIGVEQSTVNRLLNGATPKLPTVLAIKRATNGYVDFRHWSAKTKQASQ